MDYELIDRTETHVLVREGGSYKVKTNMAKKGWLVIRDFGTNRQRASRFWTKHTSREISDDNHVRPSTDCEDRRAYGSATSS